MFGIPIVRFGIPIPYPLEGSSRTEIGIYRTSYRRFGIPIPNSVRYRYTEFGDSVYRYRIRYRYTEFGDSVYRYRVRYRYPVNFSTFDDKTKHNDKTILVILVMRLAIEVNLLQ